MSVPQLELKMDGRHSMLVVRSNMHMTSHVGSHGWQEF
jgi:hypothetical protein